VLHSSPAGESFLSQVDSGLARALNSEATLHGIRVQSMFRGMIANFDCLRLLKEEDSGECYYRSDDEILVPDFRVVTEKGESLLIETKNHFSKDPMRQLQNPPCGPRSVRTIRPSPRYSTSVSNLLGTLEPMDA
jgi:hypothetical protein